MVNYCNETENSKKPLVDTVLWRAGRHRTRTACR